MIMLHQLRVVSRMFPYIYHSKCRSFASSVCKQTACRNIGQRKIGNHQTLTVLKINPSIKIFVRWKSGRHYRGDSKNILMYIAAIFVFMVGMSYAGVPLYRLFCQSTGIGGTTITGQDSSKVSSMKPVERPLTVRFNADTASSMAWNFRPLQREVKIYPGETALAFYAARNPTDKPIIGIATYNVLPFEAGQYFNKIQCFCFEEQRLDAHEEVDMPVLFFVDPEFCDDPRMENVRDLTLSYTFFEAKDDVHIPIPSYAKLTHGPKS